MLVYSGEFFFKYVKLFEEKYAEKICKIWHAVHICDIYAAYMWHIFPHISGICNSSDEEL